MKKSKGIKHYIQSNMCAIFITRDKKIVVRAVGFNVRDKGNNLISAKRFNELLDALVIEVKLQYGMETMLTPGLRKEFELGYAFAPTEYPHLSKNPTKTRKRVK